MKTQDFENLPDNEQLTKDQFEKSKLEIEKLRAEIDGLRGNNRWENRISRYIPVLTILIGVASFWFGIYQFSTQQTLEIEKLRGEFNNSIDLSEKEFRREFYKKQMDIYFDLSKTAAQISTNDDANELKTQRQHFFELMNGNLSIVENPEVRTTANQFAQSLSENNGVASDRQKLQTSARLLSEACHAYFKNFWKIIF